MRRTTLMLALTLALGVSPGRIGILTTQQVPDPRVADLIQAGKLRAGLGVVAPHWAMKDPATGELRGVAVDLARALAARLGIEFVPVEYPSPPKVLEGLKVGAWDVGFLGVDPARAAVVDFSPPYVQIDATYLVPAGSSIHNLADADQPGVLIAVSRASVEDTVARRITARRDCKRRLRPATRRQCRRVGHPPPYGAPVFSPPTRLARAGGPFPRHLWSRGGA